VLGLAVAAHAPAATLRLGGVLEVGPRLASRWSWAGAWLYPIGDPHDFTLGASGDARGFTVLRTVERRMDGSVSHQGADLGNRVSGDRVRAAANGIVLHVGWQSGYGRHVVLAHRLVDGTLVFTVYAHLRDSSVVVREGQTVGAGRPLGRVGRTGRASTNHLHFEVRRPEDPSARWENATVVEPLAFVAQRLPTAHEAPKWAVPYLEWAELGALVDAGAPADAPLEHAAWWRLLASAARHDFDAVPSDPDSLHDLLVESSLLPTKDRTRASEKVTWAEMARDLVRLRAIGRRVPPIDHMTPAAHRERCARELGEPDPGRHPANIRGNERSGPTLAAACLACAEPPASQKVWRLKKRPARP
jgi:hypothetical protein